MKLLLARLNPLDSLQGSLSKISKNSAAQPSQLYLLTLRFLAQETVAMKLSKMNSNRI